MVGVSKNSRETISIVTFVVFSDERWVIFGSVDASGTGVI